MPHESAVPPPYGIEPRHLDSRGYGWVRLVIKYAIIGVPLLAAALGLLGGGEAGLTRTKSAAATLAIETPRVLRSGNWFESRVIVQPVADVADLTVAIDQPLWRELSVDTMAPDAAKAEATEGRFTYSFGPVARGDRFVLKLDGQIQPHWLRRLEGRIAIRDGERELVSAPVSIQVLP